jgi:hypothetical protein
MAQSRQSGILVALGVVVILISVLADFIGVGQVHRFGWKQIVGVVIGVVIVGIGYYLRPGGPRT